MSWKGLDKKLYIVELAQEHAWDVLKYHGEILLKEAQDTPGQVFEELLDATVQDSLIFFDAAQIYLLASVNSGAAFENARGTSYKTRPNAVDMAQYALKMDLRTSEWGQKAKALCKDVDLEQR